MSRPHNHFFADHKTRKFEEHVEKRIEAGQERIEQVVMSLVFEAGGRAAARAVGEWDLEHLREVVREVVANVLSQASAMETSYNMKESEAASRRMLKGILATCNDDLDPLESASVIALARDGSDPDEAVKLVKGTRKVRKDFHELREDAEGADE